MPKKVPEGLAERRRLRLQELFEQVKTAREGRLTQRDFAQTIHREQGTIGAILAGHRALGGRVLADLIKVYRLPHDYFDAPEAPSLRAPPEPAPERAPERPENDVPPPAPTRVELAVHPAVHPLAPEPVGPASVELAEALRALSPDRAVAMAVTRLAQRGRAHDAAGWERVVIAAQSAHDRGVLGEWFEREVARLPSPAQRATTAAILGRK